MNTKEFLDLIKIPYYDNEQKYKNDLIAYIVHVVDGKPESEDNASSAVYISRNATPDIVVRLLFNSCYNNGLGVGLERTTEILKEYLEYGAAPNPTPIADLVLQSPNPYNVREHE